MERINFQDGQKISSAKVTIDEVDYPVTPARYTGATPLSSQVLNTMQTNIENAINQNTDNIGGEEYDETATYEEGDIVKYEGQLYICIEAIDTPEEWDSTHWDETDVLSSAGGNEVVIGTDADITGKTKIFIDESEGTDAYSEVVNSLSGNEIAKAPSVRAVNDRFTYSTTEQVIGTWIDGKPLYRKVSTGTLSSTASPGVWYDFMSNIAYLRSVNCVLAPVGSGARPYNYYIDYNAGNPRTAFDMELSADNVIRYRVLNSNIAGMPYILTIEYTKTTD